MISTTYEPFDGELQNPDRGFYKSHNLINSAAGGVRAQTDYAASRQAGYALVRAIVRLDDFRSSPISDIAIAEMNAGFASMRSAGVKTQLWFMYNFPATWDVSTPPQDAPVNVVLGHLDQLKPVFEKNKDVIGMMSLGFIGAWGEGHSSTNNLEEPAAKRTIYEKVLAVLPADRMVQLRTTLEVSALVASKVDATIAHDQSAAARTGLMNACFMVNDSDAGTFLPANENTMRREYLADISKYTVVGGETCEVPTTTRRDNCTNAKLELKKYHFTYLNDWFYGPTIESWKRDGCYNEIRNKLGYRLELLGSEIAQTTRVGAPFNVKLVLKNNGYVAPYNPRGFALVLRNKSTQAIVWLPVRKDRDKTLDPRMWLPEDGDITVNLTPLIPTNTPAGNYEVLLSLHDPEQDLSSKPAYSIRTANKDIWEAGSGWNRLTNEIQITQ